MRSVNRLAIACVATVALSAAPGFAQSGGGQTGAGGQAGTGGQSGTGGQAGTSGGQMGAGAGQSGDYGSSSNRSQGDLQKFVEQAAINNMAEIQLSQLAQQKAQDPQVKQFAQTMIDQHTQAQNQLQQAASGAGLSLPSSLDSKHQKIHDKLSNLSGADFDRQYMKVMVKSHEDTQKLLQKRAGKQNASSSYGASGGAAGTSGTTGGTVGTSGQGQGEAGSGSTAGSAAGISGTAGSGAAVSIDSWAAQTLPEVQQHLQQAKDLEKQVKQESKNNKSGGNDKRER